MSGGENDNKKTGYRLEYASSNRAKCSGPKPCSGTPISKGDLRLGTLLDYNGNKSFKWRHWGCATSRIISNFKNQFGAVDEIEGFDDLRDEDKVRVHRAWAEGHVADEDIPLTARKNGDEVGSVGSKKKVAGQGEDRNGLDEPIESNRSSGNQTSINNQSQHAASLSRAAESLARAAAKLSEAARAMSLVAGGLSQANLARNSGVNGSGSESPQLDRAGPAASNDAATNEDEGEDLPQPYRLLLDDEADVLLVLCSLIYDLPKVVCYFTCGSNSLKFYKCLIDGMTAANAVVADPYDKSSIDSCYNQFIKEVRAILLLSESDIPSTPPKEVSEYTVIHIGWPSSRRQYVGQRRTHHASTNLLLAYSGDKDLYSSGPSIMSQTIAWPGDTGRFRASVDIFRPLFEERLSEVSFELKEEVYLDWIHLHSRQGPRSVTSWTPSALVGRANRFILGPLAYKNPESLAQGSTLEMPLVDLLPEVSTEFVAEHGLKLAVDEGLLRVETEVGMGDTYETGNGANSANRPSAEGVLPHAVSEADFTPAPQFENATEEHDDQDQKGPSPTPTEPHGSVGTFQTPYNFHLSTGETYFALDEDFDSIPLICFLTSRFSKTILFLEGAMLKSYRNLFRKLMRQQVLMLQSDGSLKSVEQVLRLFTKSTSPAVLLIGGAIKELPNVLKQYNVGCWIYWMHDTQIETVKKVRSQIKSVMATVIVSSSQRGTLVSALPGFWEHPQSSLILARDHHSSLESERSITRSALMSERKTVLKLYRTCIIALRNRKHGGKRSAQEAVRLANCYAARVLLHGSQEDGSKIFPPIAGRPPVRKDTVKFLGLQPAIDTGLLYVD